MPARERFTNEKALHLAGRLGLEFDLEPFDLEQWQMGLNVELEHGTRDTLTDVTGDDPMLTAKIALAHLRELPDYYTRLASMEAEAEA